jgi:hypothetical protein
MGSTGHYSGLDLPPYRYVPGRTPHPVRDERGHSYGRDVAPIRVEATGWRSSTEYLHAIDLFNEGYYWECHEILEAIWNGVGRSGDVAAFAQGVIQVAAALLKLGMSERDAALGLARRGAAKLRAGPSPVLGVDAHRLADDVDAFLAGRVTEPPRIVLTGDPPSPVE